jgi:hypothetical protein
MVTTVAVGPGEGANTTVARGIRVGVGWISGVGTDVGVAVAEGSGAIHAATNSIKATRENQAQPFIITAHIAATPDAGSETDEANSHH